MDKMKSYRMTERRLLPYYVEHYQKKRTYCDHDVLQEKFDYYEELPLLADLKDRNDAKTAEMIKHLEDCGVKLIRTEKAAILCDLHKLKYVEPRNRLLWGIVAFLYLRYEVMEHDKLPEMKNTIYRTL